VASTSAVPIVGLYGPTLPARSAPWRGAGLVAEAVEVPNLPCRPCDQRVCAPGDFRCLTWVQPEQVIDAAERALARARLVRCLRMPDTVAAPAPPDRVEQVGFVALCGVAALLQFSIAAAQILLAVTLVCWVTMLASGRIRFGAPRFFWPLLAYAAATILSASLSPDPRTSLIDCKQLSLFLLVPIVYSLATGSRRMTMMSVIVTSAAISAAFGIFEYGILNFDNLHRRIQGTLGHYMTYSGLLMLVIGVAKIARCAVRQKRAYVGCARHTGARRRRGAQPSPAAPRWACARRRRCCSR